MELFKILGTIAIDNGKANQAIGETGDHASKMASTLGTAFNKAGKFAVAAGKVIAKGLAVSSVAMGKLISSAVESYAEYEQLVGGVETLFKDSGNKVMQYAQEAYKTAGLSANEYMSTVTSFSASLLQSMGGDTAKSAEIADMAIRDMSDNANKMGTDMGAIQNAYMGFAKQNYTMLDNLKLGYGGTQSEMKRLLKDAQKLTGVKYNINNLADVYAAIHAIQEEMGITGTTAAEAEQTISGSLASMKASWQNLLNGIAGAGDLDSLITSFVGSTKTFVGNLTKLMPNLVKGVNGLISGIAPQIPGMLQGILPGLLEGAVSLFEGLAMSLPDLLGIITDELPNILRNIASAFERVFPAIAQSIGKMFTNLVADLPQILQSIGSIITSVWGNGIWPMIQGLFSAVFGVELPDWNTITTAISNAWNNTVWPAISGYFKATFGIELQSFSDITFAISYWWESLIWPKVQDFFKATFGIEVPPFSEIVTSISDWWANVTASIGNLFSEVFEIEVPNPQEIINKIQNWWEGIKSKLGLNANYSATFTTDSGNEFGGKDGSFKTGLDFVPRDNFIARLHQGEAVLTAEEARAWRNGQYGRQEVYHGESIITGNNFYIQQESDIYDLAVELSSLRRESRRGKGART